MTDVKRDTDGEPERLRQVERKACALYNRLCEKRGLLSDPEVLRRAEELCEEARAAVSAYVAGRSG
jgi:hypothetical protein